MKVHGKDTKEKLISPRTPVKKERERNEKTRGSYFEI